MAFAVDPAVELTRGQALKPAHARAICKLSDGELDLTAGQMARVAAGLIEAGKSLEKRAIARLELKDGQMHTEDGVLFTHKPAHKSERIKGPEVRLLLPRDQHPECYGETNNSEKVDIKVGPLA